MAKSDFKFHFPIRVRWFECDMQGVVYYGKYHDYLEIAQVEYYRNLGFKLYNLEIAGYFDTAMVKLTVEYKAPARLDEMIEVYSRISHIGNTSITLNTEIYREGSDELLTRAEAVYAGIDSEQGVTKVVPEDIRTLVAHFEETGEVLPIERFPNLLKYGQ